MSFTGMQWQSVVQNSVLSPNATPIVDLGRIYDFLSVYIPVINTGNLQMEVSATNVNAEFFALGGRTINAYSIITDANTAAIAGNVHDVWRLGGHQFLRINQYSAQNANTTWKFRGVSI